MLSWVSDFHSGLGVMIRNGHRELLVTETRSLKANWGVVELEAVVACYGLELALCLVMRRFYRKGILVMLLVLLGTRR